METRRYGATVGPVWIMRLLGVLAVVVLVLAPVRLTVVDAASPITVQQNIARSVFPKEVDFVLQAQSTAQITGVRLAYQVADQPMTRVAKATFTPSNRVDASYQIDTSREYYPPGTVIHYRWLLQDQTGTAFSTRPSDLTIVDGRFSWRSLSEGGITLHWYLGDNQWVRSMAQIATAVATRSAGTKTFKKADLFLYARDQDFKSSLGAGADQWTGGEAFPEYGVALLFAPPDQTAIDQRSLAHELTHLVTDSGNPDPFGPLPSWLDEGLSMAAEGSPEPVFVQALQDGVRSHHLLSLQSISGNFPEDTNEATLAYAESESASRYLLTTYGWDRLNTLIAAFRRGATSDEAFHEAIGMSTREFQRKWEASIGAVPAAATPTNPSTASGESSFLVRIISAPVNFIEALARDLRRLGGSGKR